MPAAAPDQIPAMPDFAQGTHAFAHTVDSALTVLDRLGIAQSRITLRMAGPSRPGLQVVRQSPKAGALLAPSVPVTLWISGLGFFNSLPMPMRESGGEKEMGTREICEVFDDPIQKQAQWFRAGAPLFEIGPDKLPACRRWLSLFDIPHEEWPEGVLYPLALLAPTLARMAGREVGIRLAFLVLFDIQVRRFRYTRSFRILPPAEVSVLGRAYSHLGSDFIAGDRMQDYDKLAIQLGPVPLATYEWFATPPGKRLLDMTASLCLSAFQTYSIEWLVGDVGVAPRLGRPVDNSRLGLNFHLGKEVSA